MKKRIVNSFVALMLTFISFEGVTCVVSGRCSDGSTISCYGDYECIGSPGRVSCDGGSIIATCPHMI